MDLRAGKGGQGRDKREEERERERRVHPPTTNSWNSGIH